MTIIAGIQNYSEKKISDFEDFIVNQHKYKSLGFPMEQEALLAGKRKMSQISKIWRGNVNPEIKNYFGSVAAVKNLEERDEAKSKNLIIIRNI